MIISSNVKGKERFSELNTIGEMEDYIRRIDYFTIHDLKMSLKVHFKNGNTDIINEKENESLHTLIDNLNNIGIGKKIKLDYRFTETAR